MNLKKFFHELMMTAAERDSRDNPQREQTIRKVVALTREDKLQWRLVYGGMDIYCANTPSEYGNEADRIHYTIRSRFHNSMDRYTPTLTIKNGGVNVNLDLRRSVAARELWDAVLESSDNTAEQQRVLALVASA